MINGNKVTWRQAARADASPANFRHYLDQVFTYAGTASLARELQTLTPTTKLESGDVFIQGGSPGHAVIVVDVAENPAGERIFLLAQSYMPAQEIQILKSYQPELEPWYRFQPQTTLETPEWSFAAGSLKRFEQSRCETVTPLNGVKLSPNPLQSRPSSN
jgi:hypothetical protein